VAVVVVVVVAVTCGRSGAAFATSTIAAPQPLLLFTNKRLRKAAVQSTWLGERVEGGLR